MIKMIPLVLFLLGIALLYFNVEFGIWLVMPLPAILTLKFAWWFIVFTVKPDAEYELECKNCGNTHHLGTGGMVATALAVKRCSNCGSNALKRVRI